MPYNLPRPIFPILLLIYRSVYNSNQNYRYQEIAMKVNFTMWQKALNIIPEVSKEEWDQLDLVSRWLISNARRGADHDFSFSRLAGIFAFRDHAFHLELGWL